MQAQYTYVCPNCGKTFLSHRRRNRRFCSKSCNRSARNKSTAITSETFWDHVDKSGGPDACWPWMGNQNRRSHYGRLRHQGKLMYAHRVVYLLTHQHLPDDMDVMHSCDNPECVNPAHLSLGTHADNMADMIAKGRKPRGDQSARAKLTWNQVREIRARYALGNTSAPQLAHQYGVSAGAIYSILENRNWRE